MSEIGLFFAQVRVCTFFIIVLCWPSSTAVRVPIIVRVVSSDRVRVSANFARMICLRKGIPRARCWRRLFFLSGIRKLVGVHVIFFWPMCAVDGSPGSRCYSCKYESYYVHVGLLHCSHGHSAVFFTFSVGFVLLLAYSLEVAFFHFWIRSFGSDSHVR